VIRNRLRIGNDQVHQGCRPEETLSKRQWNEYGENMVLLYSCCSSEADRTKVWHHGNLQTLMLAFM